VLEILQPYSPFHNRARDLKTVNGSKNGKEEYITCLEVQICQMEITCNHTLAVLGLALPELYINPPVLHHFMFFRQLLI
jgi:hypothetical protein